MVASMSLSVPPRRDDVAGGKVSNVKFNAIHYRLICIWVLYTRAYIVLGYYLFKT